MTPASDFRPWAVIPAKRFGRAKTRLGAALQPGQRRELARALFERVLGACRGCSELCGTLVATDGDDVAALAARHGAFVVRDEDPPPISLAAVVDAALAAARARGATHALVVMGDLPQVGTRDLRELLAQLRAADVVLAPDLQRRGTSALGLRLDLGLHTAFGSGESLRRHLHATELLGARSRVIYNPHFAVDMDTPEDLGVRR